MYKEVSCFPLHFMLYRGNFDYFSDSMATPFDPETFVRVTEALVRCHVVVVAKPNHCRVPSLVKSKLTVGFWGT